MLGEAAPEATRKFVLTMQYLHIEQGIMHRMEIIVHSSYTQQPQHSQSAPLCTPFHTRLYQCPAPRSIGLFKPLFRLGRSKVHINLRSQWVAPCQQLALASYSREEPSCAGTLRRPAPAA